MSYPIEILPNNNYKFITCDLSNYHLIRHTSASSFAEQIDESTGLLKQDYICKPRENICDLSTSLLSIFNNSHLSLNLLPEGKQKYNHYCPADLTVDIPVLNTDYETVLERHFWSILISKINQQQVDYQKSNDPFIAICCVCHTPMKWNYWHFSIRWLLPDGFLHEKPEEEIKKKWVSRLAHEARSLVAMHAKSFLPEYELLEEAYYKKTI